jgi:transcriptional regulator of aromatic amino acid metabolism
MLLSVADTDLDAGEVEDALIRLRRELLQHPDVADVRTVSPVPAAAGSKAVDGLVAALSVTVLHPTVLVAVVETIRAWTARRGRTIRVVQDGDVLELTGVTSAQQQQVIDAWLRRHADAPT